MQDAVGFSGLDPQFVLLRNTMRERIFDYIGRKQSTADWRRWLPELAARLEEILFTKFSNKNDYYNMMKGPVEPQLQFAIKTLSAQNQQLNQQNQQMPMQIAQGSVSNGYQHISTSVPQNSSTSNVPSTVGPEGIQRQVTDMLHSLTLLDGGGGDSL